MIKSQLLPLLYSSNIYTVIEMENLVRRADDDEDEDRCGFCNILHYKKI